MKKDKYLQQFVKLEAMRRRAQERFEDRCQRIDKRAARARQRTTSNMGKPSNEQQRIIVAALELLDEVGINDLSLRRLASKLDLKAPALYWHFKSKDVLIDYMAEAILKSEFYDLEARQNNEPWQDWLVHTCSRLRNAMRNHRDGARIVAGAHLQPAITLMRLFETSIQSLVSAGIEMRRAHLIIVTAIYFVFGNVIEEQASPTSEEFEQKDFNACYQAYPLLTKSIDMFHEAVKSGYDEFEESLRLIVGYAEK